MPTYEVSFTTEEKKMSMGLKVKADRIDFGMKGIIRLVEEGKSGNPMKVTAVVPLERVLYVAQVEDEQ